MSRTPVSPFAAAALAAAVWVAGSTSAVAATAEVWLLWRSPPDAVVHGDEAAPPTGVCLLVTDLVESPERQKGIAASPHPDEPRLIRVTVTRPDDADVEGELEALVGRVIAVFDDRAEDARRERQAAAAEARARAAERMESIRHELDGGARAARGDADVLLARIAGIEERRAALLRRRDEAEAAHRKAEDPERTGAIVDEMRAVDKSIDALERQIEVLVESRRTLLRLRAELEAQTAAVRAAEARLERLDRGPLPSLTLLTRPRRAGPAD